ncbi:hypothetical protein [Corynebacterium diphtheriae]|uniref:hypothetical protein n=1 Tax=Corynebacterium diphtheriae TaxID=1717 RepID=UPI0013FD40EB|nr:hypothetical protein [Corynebacterium diphtheriae]
MKFRLSTFTSEVGQTTLLGRCGESEVRQAVVFEEGVGGGADAHGSERTCDDGQDACDEVADGGAAFLWHDWCLSLWCWRVQLFQFGLALGFFAFEACFVFCFSRSFFELCLAACFFFGFVLSLLC